MGRLKQILISASFSLLTACAGSGAGLLGAGAIVGDRNLASAEPLFSEDGEDCLDSGDQFLELLYPDPHSTGSSKPEKCRHIVNAFKNALPYGAHYTPQRRNEITDLLIATSNRKCGRYTALIKSADVAWNSQLGILSIMTGGLGAILGGENTAKALSGTSTILNGSRSAVNETVFHNQTIHVLATAYEKARQAQRRTITNRQACTTDQYTLSRAIEDVFNYHSSCSIVVGLYEAAKAVERSDSPGMNAMRAQMAALISLRRQADELSETGEPTIITSLRGPLDIQALNEANNVVIAAKKDVDTAQVNKDKADEAAKAILTTPPPNESESDKKTREAAEQELRGRRTKAANDLDEAKAKQQDAEIRLSKIVQALASATPSTLSVVEDETRICPYDVAAKSLAR